MRARRTAMAGDTDAAIPLYAEAVSRGSNSPEVFNDLGTLLARRGQLPPAVIQFEIALSLAPRAPDIRKNLMAAVEELALGAFRQGRCKDAVAGYLRLTELDPTCATFHTNTGAALREMGQQELALPHLRRAAEIEPASANAHANLGTVLFELSEREAEVELALAVALDPRHVGALVNLAAVYNRLGRLADAVALLERALAVTPDRVEAHANLAAILKEQGEITDSLAHYRRALELAPDSAMVFSGYLLTRQADPEVTPAALLDDHRRWAARFAQPLGPGQRDGLPGRDRDAGRRLRVGYVSADLRNHAVASFVEPLLGAHDGAGFEVHAYSDAVPDAVTARLRGHVAPDCWHDVRKLGDQELAAKIAADGVDVLVDLAGHTAGNRLLCFARRPAPVQVSYCGYPGTTGLAQMGWRLTDDVADPASEGDQHHVERLWRLPHGFLCYQPPADAGDPAPAPSLLPGADGVTFGCFNNLSKVGPAVLDAWAEILNAVPRSRLLLKSRALSDEQPRQRLRQRFADRGVAADRVDFAPYAPSTAAHLALYARVDVGLDPFPYNGTTTTCEALWMGVPVVTLRGHAHSGRVGASLLARIGLEDLVADSLPSYIDLAARLASDSDRLADLRANLRSRMSTSPLTNPNVITRDIEAAFREMWRRHLSE